MEQSEIRHYPDGTTALIGPDATRLMHIHTVYRGLKMYIDSGGRMVLTRGATIGLLLQRASAITGKTYSSRKKADYQRAMEDVKLTMHTLRAALPDTNSKGENL